MAWPLNAAIIGDGYALSEQPDIRRTPMEQGPDRKVRLSTNYRTLIDVAVLVTAAELQTFRSFYEGEAAHGTAFFDMDLITTNGVDTHSVRIENVSTSMITNDQFQIRLSLETREHIA